MAVRRLELLPGAGRNVVCLLGKKRVTYQDTGDVVVFTAPAGYYCLIDQVIAVTTTAWDGSGASLKVGRAADDDGYLTAGNVSAGSYGTAGASDQGALLWNNTDKHQKRDGLTAGQTVVVNVNNGTGETAGQTDIFVFGILVRA